MSPQHGPAANFNGFDFNRDYELRTAVVDKPGDTPAPAGALTSCEIVAAIVAEVRP